MAGASETERRFPNDYAAMKDASALFDRYAAHGRSNNDLHMYVLPKGTTSEESPVAMITPGGACVIVRVSDDYSKVAAQVGEPHLFDSPEMKAMLIAHEDMHCRIGITEIDQADTGLKTLTEMHDQLTNESIADSMAVLAVARRDGPEKALGLIEQMKTLRAAGAKVGDNIHDTRKSLDLLADTIKNHPERYANDGSAFLTAIDAGARGANATYPSLLNAAERSTVASPTFSAYLDKQADRLSASAAEYFNGQQQHTPNSILTDRVTWSYDRQTSAAEGSAKPVTDTIREEVKAAQREMKENVLAPSTTAGATDTEHPYVRGYNQGMAGSIEASPAKILQNQNTPAVETTKAHAFRM